MTGKPAVLGGTPLLSTPLPMTRPTLVDQPGTMERIRAILASGMLTDGPTVAEFEHQAARYLGVEDVVAVNSCTSGLMLVLRCLGRTGDVLLPSFTFMASGHAVMWNGLRPRFADVAPDTFTLDPRAARAGDPVAILGVHTFGMPADADELAKVAAARGAELILDAAHGFGGRYPDGTRVGSKGLAEVFSLSPTKPLTTAEGGLVATDDRSLAAELRHARNYGNPGDYDSRLVGLNARMTEISAAMGLCALPALDATLDRRRALAGRYVDGLAGLPLGVQRVPDGCTPVYKDFTILVDPRRFGIDRDRLAQTLAAEGISTRSYFDPPLHRQTAYASCEPVDLPVTDAIAGQCLTLPLYSHMPESAVDMVIEAIIRAYDHREELA
ncbi:DegT/DnrJ/EryC1/StrS family aminotransferase [Micromonospora inyonensis]|uniref:dTDP-4-amino-4,6-dideoxygalactose transaminase n=1 Tax=Micromonospora inyonensis TaxID=47866 RepID=A0A1C6S764_9ACTN|nr:DegT/DnrJ/EryC1/StrS family aminotransferase [Micromonospora inyonensis]SCL25307.1 dTDP-4-amino-4,6-dideoxygalactose transaminase [Micromonospora inyonensis]